MRTLFLQEILRRGVLGQSYVISAAHTDADVEQTVEAARAAAVTYRKALETGRPEELFHGRPVAPGHRRMAEPRRLSLPALPSGAPVRRARRRPDDAAAGLLGRVVQASSSISAVTADSVSGMPRSAARLSAMCSSRRIRPATASLVIGGSAS